MGQSHTGPVLAGKAHDGDKPLNFTQSAGVISFISPKSNRKSPVECRLELYKQRNLRNLIERAFNKLKHWRRTATRYARRSPYFLAAMHPVAAIRGR